MAEIKQVDFEIVDCSPKAAAAIVERDRPLDTTVGEENSRSKYPFGLLAVGTSLKVPASEIDSDSSLRSAAARYGRSHKKRFKVITHREIGYYEIARID